MDIKQISANLMGAVNADPNYGSVLDTAANTGAMNNIRALNGLKFRGERASEAIGTQGGVASVQASNEEAQRKAAAAQAEAAESARLKEIERLENPKNYKQIVNDVGGYDFYDPLGNKITAVEYSKKTNKQMLELYKDSEDPADKDFMDDYKRVMELGRAAQAGDTKARDKIFKENPEFKEQVKDMTFQDIVKNLHGAYPGYFRSNDQLARPADVGRQIPVKSSFGDKAKKAVKGWFD